MTLARRLPDLARRHLAWLSPAAAHLKGYALCRRPLLGHRGCHLAGLAPPFWHPGDHFGTPGDHFGTLGAPWGAMGAAGKTPWGPESDFCRFW